MIRPTLLYLLSLVSVNHKRQLIAFYRDTRVEFYQKQLLALLGRGSGSFTSVTVNRLGANDVLGDLQCQGTTHRLILFNHVVSLLSRNSSCHVYAKCISANRSQVRTCHGIASSQSYCRISYCEICDHDVVLTKLASLHLLYDLIMHVLAIYFWAIEVL